MVRCFYYALKVVVNIGKTNIAVTNDIAWTIQQIQDLYMQGNIRGFTIQIMQNDGESMTAHCGELSFIEKLGLIEMAKQDMTLSVNGLV